MNREELEKYAISKMKDEGYSCSQSMVITIIECIRNYENISKEKEQEYLNIASGYGGGIASLGQTCGFISGSTIGYSLIIKDDVELLKEKTRMINKLVINFVGHWQCQKIIQQYGKVTQVQRREKCIEILEYLVKYVYDDISAMYQNK